MKCIWRNTKWRQHSFYEIHDTERVLVVVDGVKEKKRGDG